jgi:hypothetical protein
MDVNLFPQNKERKGLQVFENRLLRKVIRCKREKVTGAQGKVHIDYIRNLSSADIVRVNK